MEYKRELLNKAKEMIDSLNLETLERLDLTINDKYDSTIDIDISIEIERELPTEIISTKE